MSELISELEKLGFGRKKAALYLVLLQRGGGSATELAEAAGIKRTTAYELLEELCGENLASISAVGNRRYFAVESPEGIGTRLKRQQQIFDQVLPQLTQFVQADKRKLRVRYFEGVEGSIFVHEELLRKTRKEYFYFGSMKTFSLTTPPEYRRKYVTTRIARGIWSNALLVDDGSALEYPEIRQGQESLRRVRYLRDETGFPIANTVLFEGLIAIYGMPRDNYSMLIDSESLYSLLMLLWKALWAVSPENVDEIRQKKS